MVRILLLLRIVGIPRILESVFCNWRCGKSEIGNCATTRTCIDNFAHFSNFLMLKECGKVSDLSLKFGIKFTKDLFVQKNPGEIPYKMTMGQIKSDFLNLF